MKKRKAIITFEPRGQTMHELQRQDILRAFYDKLKTSEKGSLVRDVIRQVYLSEAPRFYTDYDNTCRYISLIYHNKPLPIKNENKKRMYYDIYRLWQKKVGPSPKNYTGLLSVLCEPAPEWYLTESRVIKIIYTEIQKRKKYGPNNNEREDA